LTPRFFRLCQAVAAALCVAATAVPASAQPSSSTLKLLDVPYVPQSIELCGGAAAAMVMRYWGETGIYAEDFSELVDREAGGIRGEDLLRALHTRGWQAVSFEGTGALVREGLNALRPPIALIEDRPARFHYVVIVGWHDGRVVLHDPARAPFRILDEVAFMRAWSRAGFWTMLVAPESSGNAGAVSSPAAERVADTTAPGRVCAGLVEQAVRLANDGSLDDARALLTLAAARCPREAAPWRELAGLHAVSKDWKAAAADARRALARDGGDAHAARILATSLFLEGDSLGALDAWNLVGEPTIDLVDVRGLERTRFAVAAGAIGLSPRTRLTAEALERAGRRLDALPVVSGSRVTYAPDGHGLAQVTAAVIERPVFPRAPLALAAVGLQALTDRELRLQVAGPTGGGELWHAAWRWWEGRPRVSVGLAVPAFGGTLSLEGLSERQTYRPGPSEMEEERRQLSVSMARWATHAIRLDGAVAVDEWDRGTAAAVAGGVDVRLAADRVSLQAQAGAWAGAVRTWSLHSSVNWRSRSANEGMVWLSRGGVSAVGAEAPLALWAGAGTGQGRSELLRAHPLLEGGVIGGGAFGRRLVHATTELRRWSPPLRRVLRVGSAAFVDFARASAGDGFGDSRAHVDVGVGLRLALPGSGVLRADLARGLRDGDVALSFGWSLDSARSSGR